MVLPAPAEIRLGAQALTLLHRVLDAAAPDEGCGLLLGCREVIAGPASFAGSGRADPWGGLPEGDPSSQALAAVGPSGPDRQPDEPAALVCADAPAAAPADGSSGDPSARGGTEDPGLALGSRWRLLRLWPCANAWQPAEERGRRFLIDPREQLLAMKWARRHGLELLGSVHSHPASEARPSDTDRALAVPPALMLIRGWAEASAPDATGAGQPVLRCWWLEEGAQPQLLPWTMED